MPDIASSGATTLLRDNTRPEPEPAPELAPNAAPGASAIAGGHPQRIGRYQVLRRLGEGGMGVVYAGYDEELGRKVAIKLLHPAQQGDSELRARIIREAQALARVSSPNVIQAYEVGELSTQLFIVMEFVDGTTLTRWQSEKRRSWQDVVRMYCEAGQGLLEAHKAGLVHRDFSRAIPVEKIAADRAAERPRYACAHRELARPRELAGSGG